MAGKSYKHIDFKPPESVASAAERGLEYRKRQGEDKAGLTPSEAAKEGIGSGVQRATNLKNRSNVSPKVIKQMVAFFSRHQKNKSVDSKFKNEPWRDKGYVSWLLWGGDPGKSWAEKVLRQMESADAKTAGLLDHELAGDLASAYRGKRMRDAIRDMQLAGVPEALAKTVYDAIGEHADRVRAELHRAIERTDPPDSKDRPVQDLVMAAKVVQRHLARRTPHHAHQGSEHDGAF